MAILSGQCPPIVRDAKFGKNCSVEVVCQKEQWAIVFGRNGKEVFRAPLEQFDESPITFSERVFHTAEDDILDFINAETTCGNCNSILTILQKMVSVGSLKVAESDHERQLVRTIEPNNQSNDGKCWSILKTFRGREVLRILHTFPLYWPDYNEVERLIDELGDHFESFVNAKIDRNPQIQTEVILLRYENNRRKHLLATISETKAQFN